MVESTHLGAADDWYDGAVPHNARIDPGAYLESTFSFVRYRSRAELGFSMEVGAHAYLGCMFDVGPSGRLLVGEYALLNGVWVMCDAEVVIGDHALVSWNVVIMDSHRAPRESSRRRAELEAVPRRPGRQHGPGENPRPVLIGRASWIGFDVTVMPGVTIGEGSVVGARSTVFSDIPPFVVAGGNPAKVIRSLTATERQGR
jgi:acetyltransferase-like isoleucine patch superfamily enzyme